MISVGEKDFFELIKNDCKIIFDIGCREDIYYIKNSTHKILYLFEPNPVFYANCKTKINKFIEDEKISANKISLFNFGIGNKTEKLKYYLDTQSFFKRHNYIQPKTASIFLSVKKFSEFLEENNIEFIDFLKMDVEGYEPTILFDNVDFIKNNIKYIQFEWASTWFSQNNKITFVDVFNIYKNNFTFYFLYDKDHPFAECCPETLIPIVNQQDFEMLNEGVHYNYGANIAMIKRQK